PIDVAGGPPRRRAIEVGRGRPELVSALEEQVAIAAMTRRLYLLHLPWTEGPVRPGCPLVLTLFDLSLLERASAYGVGFRVYYTNLLRAHMQRASAVIVSSEA